MIALPVTFAEVALLALATVLPKALTASAMLITASLSTSIITVLFASFAAFAVIATFAVPASPTAASLTSAFTSLIAVASVAPVNQPDQPGGPKSHPADFKGKKEVML
jgi:hypothetical protein